MNRFQKVFLDNLVELGKEYGFVINEGGYIEPISDWVTPGKEFRYTVKEDDTGVKITGVEMI